MVFELVKLFTPLQAGLAVVVCVALSAHHMSQYNKHMEKYAPLGGLIVDKRTQNKRGEAEEITQQPRQELTNGGVGDGTLQNSRDRLV